jgi:hypothetical protein
MFASMKSMNINNSMTVRIHYVQSMYLYEKYEHQQQYESGLFYPHEEGKL